MGTDMDKEHRDFGWAPYFVVGAIISVLWIGVPDTVANSSGAALAGAKELPS